MPKYYGNSYDSMLEILESIRRCGCSFLVAGRLMDGKFKDARAVEPPPGYEGALSRFPRAQAPRPACGRRATASVL